jgi:AcrR family transcriptional regulator
MTEGERAYGDDPGPGQATDGQAPERQATERPSHPGGPTDTGGPGPSSPRPRRRLAVDETTARQRVIQAAISCILERGFYRASSNAIAERAGVTWGVIQHYFGTREKLMLAVLETGSSRFVADLAAATITGTTRVDRIAEFSEILAGHYASPDYLAFTQILLNLGHDPSTSQQTLDTMRRIDEPADRELRRLHAEVFAGEDIPADERRGGESRILVFHVLRGLALSEVMLRTLPADASRATWALLPIHHRLLAEALALLIGRTDDPREAGPAEGDGTAAGRTGARLTEPRLAESGRTEGDRLTEAGGKDAER